MKRRILSLLLVLALTAGLLPAVQAADSFQLTYTEISDPAGLEITGCTGEPPRKLVIPESIDGKSVVSIGAGAFKFSGFEEVVLPDSVKKIKSSAFMLSLSLRSVSLGSVESLDASVFERCFALTQVTLPDTLTEIGSGCFYQTGLTEITIPGSVKSIPAWCFSDTPLRHVTICEGVESIDYAFFQCALEGSIILPESLNYLGYYSFNRNPDLWAVILLGEDPLINESQSESCTIYRHMPERPEKMHPWDRYVSLEELPYDPTVANVTEGPLTYCICDGVACVTHCTATGDYTLPDTLGGCPVGIIGPFAFSDATDLSRVTLPDSITEICRGAFCGTFPVVSGLPKRLKTIGEAAFYNPVNQNGSRLTLRDGTIPDGVTEISASAFGNVGFIGLALPAGLETIGDGAFSGMRANSITFSGSVREIGPSAFSGVITDSIELPEGLESIGDSAFENTGTLSKLFLPHSLRQCGDIFGIKSSGHTVVYGYTDTPAYEYCTENDIDFIDRENGTFYRAPYEITQNGVRYLIKPGKYAEIRGVMSGCPQELVIPETVEGVPVTTVGSKAFTTDAVRSVYLPDTVTTLCDEAFSGCENLESVRLSENLESVGSGCFFWCYALDYLYFPASVKNISVHWLPVNVTTPLAEEGTCAYELFAGQKYDVVALDPDEEYVCEGPALCRIEDDEAILVGLRSIDNELVVPDTVEGYPVTRIDGDVQSFREPYGQLRLGKNVTTIDEGALRNTYIYSIYADPALTSLPENLFPEYFGQQFVIYGLTGTYAENYCAAHGITFRAVDAIPFTDVPENSWYYPGVFSCYWAGYMKGTSATTFSPNGITTRAMLVTLLCRMCGEYTGIEIPFSDVDCEAYYYDSVRWAYTYGVVYGTSATTFSPNNPVTREQTATILYRLSSLMGADVDSYTPLTRFCDQAEASDYARSALMWAVDAGILQGNGKGELDPCGSTTRAQIATMIVRYVDWLTSEGLR